MESDACSGDKEGEEVEEEIFNGCAHKSHLLTRASWRGRPQRSSISSWEALVGVMMTWIKVSSSISFVVSTLDMKWTPCLMGEGKMTTQGMFSQGQTHTL